MATTDSKPAQQVWKLIIFSFLMSCLFAVLALVSVLNLLSEKSIMAPGPMPTQSTTSAATPQ